MTRQRDLKSLKAPTQLSRQAQARILQVGTFGESASRCIGPLSPGCEIYGFTKGQFSCIDIVAHCLKETGPADVTVCTWSAAAGDIEALRRFFDHGNIRSIRFIVDYSFQSRKPHFAEYLIERLGYESIRVSVTHAKFILIVNEKWNLVIRTSMNFNHNPRFENYEISDDREFAEFHKAIIDEIWNRQDVAEGFRVRPQENKDLFKRTFESQKQSSIFSDDITDGRDLI